MLETAIVVLIIAAALAYTVRRFVLARKGGCGCGCSGGCDCGSPTTKGGCPGCSQDDTRR